MSRCTYCAPSGGGYAVSLVLLAILRALLAVWDAAELGAARLVDRLARAIFGEIDREWVRAAAADARREMWS